MSQSRQLGTLEIGQAFYLPNSSNDEYVKIDIPPSGSLPLSSVPTLNLANATVRFFHSSLLVWVKSGPAFLVISEVRIIIPETGADDHFKAFASLTFNDAFVVRDIKVIKGANGLFVSMPSRKIHDHCPSCGGKNDIEALHCRVCGVSRPPDRVERDDQGRSKRHLDVAHPVNASTRLLIQEAVLEAYHAATNSPGRNAGAGTNGGH